MPSGLGRGLGSLIPKKVPSLAKSSPAPAASSGMSEPDGRPLDLAVDLIDPNPFQPRSTFNSAHLQELVESVKMHGVLEPLVVTRRDGRYELIAGERRLRASKLAGLKTVPVIVKEFVDDRMKLELALIENIQRADLNPIEEAIAYKQLMDEFGLTQDDVGVRVGKSRPTVANSVRLLKLPLEIQTALREQVVTAGQVRALISIEDPAEQLALFKKIVSGDLSSRASEEAVTEKRVTTVRRDPNLVSHENDLRNALGSKVRIFEKGGKGKIVVEFYSREELLAIKDKIINSAE